MFFQIRVMLIIQTNLLLILSVFSTKVLPQMDTSLYSNFAGYILEFIGFQALRKSSYRLLIFKA